MAADAALSLAADGDDTPAGPAAARSEEQAEREGGRRRGRGRGRGRRDGSEAENAERETAAPMAATSEAAPQTGQDKPWWENDATPAATTVADTAPAPVLQPAPPVEEAVGADPLPVPVQMAEAEASPAPISAVVTATPSQRIARGRRPHRHPLRWPSTSLRAMAASAGLEWVNSDAERILVVQQAMAREPKPAHVPRHPRPRVIADDGPLVLVETRKDLSQMKLPFEQQSRSPSA